MFKLPLASSGVAGGQLLVRMIYLDKSGNAADDPWVVEAGIIANPDEHLGQIEDLMEAARQRHVPNIAQAERSMPVMCGMLRTRLLRIKKTEGLRCGHICMKWHKYRRKCPCR